MGLKRKLGLLPESAHQRRATLHRAQTTPGKVTHLANVRSTEVGDLMSLKVTPDIFDRIKLGSISRQELQLHTAVGFHVLPDHTAAMGAQPVPDDKQFTPELPAQRLEKLHHLRTADAAGKEAEVELPPSHASDDRPLLPAKAILQH